MSPSQIRDGHAPSSETNAQRSSTLKINKESHLIHKSPPSSSSSSSSSSPLTVAAAAAVTTLSKRQDHQHHPHQQRHRPVIIYTHSPKIIRTEARDFMALVQKLTGLSRSEDPPLRPPSAEGHPSSSEGNNSTRVFNSDDATSSSSSVLTDENCGMSDQAQVHAASISPIFDVQNPYFSDIPLFTPNSSDFFCSPPSAYRYPDAVFTSHNMGNANTMSPSVMDVLNLKAYQGCRQTPMT
ncbi:VQ motif-containing protein 8, chloroplastic-like [Aristolochia californica]|uniref:VQ motif-containing protein 8, chloroplastic-like n=1 Tax=Aristolochia californica TaxID=171875 RepID=UPI0035DE524D